MNKTKIDWATMSWNPVTGCLHDCPLNFLLGIEPIKETQWISVNDRLPECIDKYGISKIVLCLDARGRTGFGIYQNGERQLYHEGWFTGGEVGENCVKITHWMPIPDPPNEPL